MALWRIEQYLICPGERKKKKAQDLNKIMIISVVWMNHPKATASFKKKKKVLNDSYKKNNKKHKCAQAFSGILLQAVEDKLGN